MQWKSVQKSLRVASEPPFQTRLADLDVMQQLFWSRTSWHNRWQYKPQQNPILVTIICHRILTTSLRLLALKMTRNQIYGNVKLYHPFNDLRYLQNWNKADSLKYTPPPRWKILDSSLNTALGWLGIHFCLVAWTRDVSIFHSILSLQLALRYSPLS